MALDHVPRGARLELTAAWPTADAESYVWFDRDAQALGLRRESLSVAWFASSGTLDVESTGRSEDDELPSARNHWRAPDSPGSALIWLVLRDSRGGVDFTRAVLQVVP